MIVMLARRRTEWTIGERGCGLASPPDEHGNRQIHYDQPFVIVGPATLEDYIASCAEHGEIVNPSDRSSTDRFWFVETD